MIMWQRWREMEKWRFGEMEGGGRERGMGRGTTQLFLRVNGQEETIEVAYSWGYIRHTNFSCMPKWDDCEKVFVKLFGKVCSFVTSMNNNNALRTRFQLSHTGCFDAPQNCAWLFFDLAFCRQCRLWGFSRLFNSMYGLVWFGNVYLYRYMCVCVYLREYECVFLAWLYIIVKLKFMLTTFWNIAFKLRLLKLSYAITLRWCFLFMFALCIT